MNKLTQQLIDKKRIELNLKQGITVTRDEMLSTLVEKGSEILDVEFRTLADGIGTKRPGVMWFSADQPVSILGVLDNPDPWECVQLLKKEESLLLVVFGDSGCGVTTFINKILSLGVGDAYVFDGHDPNSVNIPGALNTVRENRKVILAVNAKNINEADKELARYITCMKME